jgi:hypothetical protein
VQGKWNITIKTPMGDKSGVLELKTEGTALTGSLSDAKHYAAISDGKVSCCRGSPKAGIASLRRRARERRSAPPYIDGCRSSPAIRYWMGRRNPYAIASPG